MADRLLAQDGGRYEVSRDYTDRRQSDDFSVGSQTERELTTAIKSAYKKGDADASKNLHITKTSGYASRDLSYAEGEERHKGGIGDFMKSYVFNIVSIVYKKILFCVYVLG